MKYFVITDEAINAIIAEIERNKIAFADVKTTLAVIGSLQEVNVPAPVENKDDKKNTAPVKTEQAKPLAGKKAKQVRQAKVKTNK